MDESMSQSSTYTRKLLTQAANGDTIARNALFGAYRTQLKRIVRLQLNPRLQRRVDESDVVQDVLLEATRCLPEYARTQPLPFFLWLRQIAAHKLIDLHRRHLGAHRRDARLEIAMHGVATPALTSASLAAQLIGGLTSPSSAAARIETQRLVQEALQTMDPIDREVLVLRHFEQLSNGETAAVLEISESACSNRYVRALARLRKIVTEIPGLADT
jgi:RNA polymerase sigma-70 factor (ECF subfamily)